MSFPTTLKNRLQEVVEFSELQTYPIIQLYQEYRVDPKFLSSYIERLRYEILEKNRTLEKLQSTIELLNLENATLKDHN